MGLGSRLPHLRAHSSQWLLAPLIDDGVFLSRLGLLHPPQPTNHFSIFSNIIFPFFQFNIIYSFILYIYIYIYGEKDEFLIGLSLATALLHYWGPRFAWFWRRKAVNVSFSFWVFCLVGGFLLLRSGFWLVSLICDVGLGCWMRFGMSPFLFL